MKRHHGRNPALKPTNYCFLDTALTPRQSRGQSSPGPVAKPSPLERPSCLGPDKPLQLDGGVWLRRTIPYCRRQGVCRIGNYVFMDYPRLATAPELNH